MKKVVKRVFLGICSIIIILAAVLIIYTSNPYQPLDAMYDELDSVDVSNITVEEHYDSITFNVVEPKKHILFIPGGLVDPDSYQYLAYMLANDGYNVTIFKTLRNLAILTPNYPSRLLSDELDNVIIGHSLGGTVGSMVASGNEAVSTIIFLASYPYQDVSDKDVLIITGENDTVLDIADIDASTRFLPQDYVLYEIEDGNHAQFGWYGPQKGDGQATISTLDQQLITIDLILNFIK